MYQNKTKNPSDKGGLFLVVRGDVWLELCGLLPPSPLRALTRRRQATATKDYRKDGGGGGGRDDLSIAITCFGAIIAHSAAGHRQANKSAAPHFTRALLRV